MLLPIEIENVSFSRSVGGYSPREVDEFLDYIRGKCTQSADAEARLAVSANESGVLRTKVTELEAKISALEAECDELRTINEELKNAVAEAAAQAVASAVSELPANVVENDPVWDPDVEEGIPEPFRVEDTDDIDGSADIDETAETDCTDDTDFTGCIDNADEAGAEVIDTSEDIEADEEAVEDSEGAEAVEESDEGSGGETDNSYNDDDNGDFLFERLDPNYGGGNPNADDDIAAALEAALARMEMGLSPEQPKSHDSSGTAPGSIGGIDVSLDFDEIESFGRESDDDNNVENDAGMLAGPADDDMNEASSDIDTNDIFAAFTSVTDGDGNTVDDVDNIDNVDDVDDVDNVDDADGADDIDGGYDGIDIDVEDNESDSDNYNGDTVEYNTEKEEEKESTDGGSFSFSYIDGINYTYDVDDDNGDSNAGAVAESADADNTDDTDDTAGKPVYTRRVYRIRLKRAARRQSEDQAILDALRATYSGDNGNSDDENDDDLTQHEYDEYNYTFDSGKK